MFRLLGLHPGPDITAAAAASLAGVAPARPAGCSRELAAAHLIAEHAPGRYAFHDLLRAYAAEQAAHCDSDDRPRGPPSPGCSTTTCTPPPRPLAALPRPGPARPDPPRPRGDTRAARRQAARAGLVRPPSAPSCPQPSPWPPRPDSAGAAWQLGWTAGRFLHRRGYRQEWAAILQDITGRRRGRRRPGRRRPTSTAISAPPAPSRLRPGRGRSPAAGHGPVPAAR